MKFSDFLIYVPKIAKEILPGINAHIKMMPPERLKLLEVTDFSDKNPRKAAVLMLIYPKNNLSHLALIIRNSYPGVHSSQIAFPGGKVEDFDLSLEETSLRETEEEVGISPEKIKIIRAFTEVYIPPSNFLVAPFLGFSEQELTFKLDPNEVAGLIEFPVNELFDDKILARVKISNSYLTDTDVLGFKIEEHLVWGATAMMLSELKELMKNVL
jgi:8-oxo-dGTP pyrophosphatase MutT (NUDIX family)